MHVSEEPIEHASQATLQQKAQASLARVNECKPIEMHKAL